MRIAVYGLWHLGSVTAACLAAAGHEVVGLDLDETVVTDLRTGRTPVREEGLSERLGAGLASGRLRFTTQPEEALADAELLWVTFDTPVDETDEADIGFVRGRLEAVAQSLRPGTLVLVSSQVPVGFTRALAVEWKNRGLRYASSPENLRLGKAVASFEQAERIVVGLADRTDQSLLGELLGPFCRHIEWMSLESAEMTKHALNAFLGTSVAFANEVARLCEALGADAREVQRGLQSDGRIGHRAYLSPGAPFAGGTLARDLRYLAGFGRDLRIETPLVAGVLASNRVQEGWLRDRVRESLEGVPGPVAAVLGLVYKPGTSTLRRSSALELCAWLHERGVTVRAHDPAAEDLPEPLRMVVRRCDSRRETLQGADVAVVATPWPEYKDLGAEEVLATMRRPRVVDTHWALAGTLGDDPRVLYLAPGRGRG